MRVPNRRRSLVSLKLQLSAQRHLFNPIRRLNPIQKLFLINPPHHTPDTNMPDYIVDEHTVTVRKWLVKNVKNSDYAQWAVRNGYGEPLGEASYYTLDQNWGVEELCKPPHYLKKQPAGGKENK